MESADPGDSRRVRLGRRIFGPQPTRPALEGSMPHPITAAPLPQVTPMGAAIGSALFFVVLAVVAIAAIVATRRTGRGRGRRR